MGILNDFIDIVATDEYNKKKLTFSQKNAVIYQKILTELKKRYAEQRKEFETTVPQQRNKFSFWNELTFLNLLPQTS